MFVLLTRHPKPRSMATSASRLFSYVECTENPSDACLSTFCCGTSFFKKMFSLKCYKKNYAFFVVGKKITPLTTHIHVSPYCAIIFSFLFSLLGNKDREKRYILRNSLSSTPPLCYFFSSMNKVRTYVFVFLYLLHTEYQNPHSTSEVRTFLHSLAVLHHFKGLFGG